ncbi:hypothetical protein I317_03121 [Kwoniella heveanensis CBS 569]|nr:hypothetical protein I317_03121 [Kwoniella heveanensis CBS 569]
MKGLFAASLFGLAAWLGPVQVAAEAGVYLTIEGVKGTVYYDLVSGGKCDARFGAGWGLVHGDNPSACEAARASSYVKEGVANAVAMNRNFVDRDLVDFCGRIVKVYKPNGEEYKLPNGLPFFIWDGCEDCAKEERIDLGADAIADLQDVGTDGDSNPSGCDNPLNLKVEIMNEYFWQLEPHGVVNESPGPVADPNAVYPVPTPADYQPNGLPAEYRNLPPGVATSPPVSNSTAKATATATSVGGSASASEHAAGPASGSSATASSASGQPPVHSGYSASASAPIVPSGSGSVSGPPVSVPSALRPSSIPGGTGVQSASSQAVAAASSSSSPGIVAIGASGTASSASSSTAASSTAASVSSSTNTNTSSNSTSNVDSSEAFQALGDKADCEAGSFMCEGLQLKVCNFIQPGVPDLGWVDHVTCQTVCDVECDFTCE